MASTLAKKAAGTFVEDSPPPAVPLLAWVQEQARSGALFALVESFCNEQPEVLDPRLARITRVSDSTVYGVVPARVVDHESQRPFLTEFAFWIDLRERPLRARGFSPP